MGGWHHRPAGLHGRILRAPCHFLAPPCTPHAGCEAHLQDNPWHGKKVEHRCRQLKKQVSVCVSYNLIITKEFIL
jgi:hypothetical protein